MGIRYDEINLQEIFQDLGTVCKTERACGHCAGPACLVGYSKECAANCRKKKVTYVEDGVANIPPSDIRGGYDEYDVLHAISHLLVQCRSCKETHYDNCIINVIRNCLEVIEFGEELDYEGTSLQYMMKVSQLNPEKGAVIMEEYQKKKLELEEAEATKTEVAQ
jgi:hypothetical protein